MVPNIDDIVHTSTERVLKALEQSASENEEFSQKRADLLNSIKKCFMLINTFSGEIITCTDEDLIEERVGGILNDLGKIKSSLLNLFKQYNSEIIEATDTLNIELSFELESLLFSLENLITTFVNDKTSSLLSLIKMLKLLTNDLPPKTLKYNLTPPPNPLHPQS